MLGVPLALTLGVIAFSLEFIPRIGPIAAGALAVLVAFTQSSQLALYMLALYCAIQLLESYLLLPLVQRKTVCAPRADDIRNYFLRLDCWAVRSPRRGPIDRVQHSAGKDAVRPGLACRQIGETACRPDAEPFGCSAALLPSGPDAIATCAK